MGWGEEEGIDVVGLEGWRLKDPIEKRAFIVSSGRERIWVRVKRSATCY